MTEDTTSIHIESNVESTILPLLSICNLTSEYRQEIKKLPKVINHHLLSETEEIAIFNNKKYKKLIDECQSSFEQEANILLENQMSAASIGQLFNKYKEFLISCLTSRSDCELSSDVSNLHDNLESSTLSGDTLIPDESLSFDLCDFDFDFASLTTSSILSDNFSDEKMNFSYSQLCNESDFIESKYLQTNDDFKLLQDPPNINNSNSSQSNNGNIFDSKKTIITKEKKSLLEAVYLAKSSPNSAERRFIASKCNLTPYQVRIWFRNKRARSKRKK